MLTIQRKCSGKNAYESPDPAVLKVTPKKSLLIFDCGGNTLENKRKNTRLKFHYLTLKAKKERTVQERDRRHNETSIIPYNLLVKKTEYNRVEFLLFNETIPGSDIKGSDRIDASYRDLNLWITVR